MALTHLSYDLTIGEDWERLVVIKDTRTHRIRKVSSAAAILKSPTGLNYPLTTDTNFEGGITLCLSAAQTYDLAPGTYTFDVVSNPWGSTQTVAQGTVEVQALDRITPLEGGYDMIIQFYQGTDFRQNYTWTDSAGGVLEVADARLQAVNDLDVVVLDLDFYAVAPDEATIALMDPEKRGYLAPKTDVSLELHVSEKAVIAPGTYAFDLKVQEAASGDWDVLSTGTIKVVKAITDQTAP